MLPDIAFGLYVTVSLFAIAWIIGFPVSLLITILVFLNPGFRHYVKIFSIFFAITPLLAVLFWFHYPAQTLLGIVVNPFQTSVFVLTLFVIANATDILIVNMLDINQRYVDAIKVLGVSWKHYLRKALLPVTVYSAIPRLLNLAVMTVHATMFTSLIGVEELFRVIQRLNSQFLKPVELFSIMAIGYILICLPLYALAVYMKQRYKTADEQA
jgi:polar amino acid transport system permease protein